MKKWFRFFSLSFFSHSIAREGVRRGFTNVFLSFVLLLALIWAAFFGGDMLPFGLHYGRSPDFQAVVHAVLASPDSRIAAEVDGGTLKVRGQDGEYAERLFINTLENEADREKYSKNGYNVVVDTRPADTLAEVVAYCVSNDGKETEISYEDYLTLSEVARMNFDFKLRYTGNALTLDGATVTACRTYLETLGAESKARVEQLATELESGAITVEGYNRAIYETYFASYYPEITEYESTSAVPLLRNYYYQEYISKNVEKYLFLFDDYIAGSFETKGGIDVSFYGFYSGAESGAVVEAGMSADEANASADRLIKRAFKANSTLTAYAYVMNTVTLVPFLALMLMVATLLAYSVLRLRGASDGLTLGGVFRIVGAFAWFCGVIALAITLVIMLFAERSLISALPVVLFFLALLIRTVIFVIREDALHRERREQQNSDTTEV